MPSSGSIGARPNRERCSWSSLSAAMPPPPHGPQATAVAGRPWALRRSARASRWALAAEYPAARPSPQIPAMEENITNASSGVSARRASRFSAPSTLLRTTSPSSATLISDGAPDSAMPAAWNTAVTGCSSRSAASAARSAASQATTVASAPDARSSATSSAAPGVSGPRRPVSTRLRAPRVTSQRATRPPRAPVPPVIRTVPVGCQAGPAAPVQGARTRRRARTPVARTATWSSSWPPVSTEARSATARSSSCSGRSTSPPQRPGYSRAATRPKPHTCAWAGCGARSVRPAGTACRVAHHSGASTPASPRAWTSSRVSASPVVTWGYSACGASAVPSSDRTPVTPPHAVACSRRSPARVQRSVSAGATGTVTTSAPWARRPSATAVARGPSVSSAGTTSSQVPDRFPAGVSTRCQVTR